MTPLALPVCSKDAVPQWGGIASPIKPVPANGVAFLVVRRGAAHYNCTFELKVAELRAAASERRSDE